MHKTIEHQLIEEQTYLEYLKGKFRPSESIELRVLDQIEVVRILEDSYNEIKKALVIHWD